MSDYDRMKLSECYAADRCVLDSACPFLMNCRQVESEAFSHARELCRLETDRAELWRRRFFYERHRALLALRDAFDFEYGGEAAQEMAAELFGTQPIWREYDRQMSEWAGDTAPGVAPAAPHRGPGALRRASDDLAVEGPQEV